MKIVAFNGPPESGKDTLAEMVANEMDKMGVTLPLRFESLSLPLRQIAYAIVGEEGNLEGADYAQFKTQEFELLGVTGRQLMIDVSEKFLKPTYGIQVMAKLLLQRQEGFNGVLLIRDSGFQIEVDPLASVVGHENIHIVQVHREGKSFENDSREWVFPQLGRIFSRVDNNGTLADLEVQAALVVNRLVSDLGWKL